MPRERDLLAIIVKNFINSLKPRKFFGDLKGTDNMGNKYFEIVHSHKKPSRYFTPVNKEGFDQEIPPEWEAWLRGRRSHPPTEQEILNNYKLLLQKKDNAAKIDAKYLGLKTPEPKMHPEIGMGSFPKYEEYEIMPGDSTDKTK
uniref:NADH dehydrogenase [ubiquinone] 1 alpha subcomplex subunit 12 n=1 Tax=Clastoptera arizonana TaxID=38151 RepID=A0A1B6D981_9HEMI